MDLRPDDTGKAVVPVLACVLNQLCHRNDKVPLDPKCISKFHALRPPAISIVDYLERIGKYACCSGECFVLALIYIDRIIQTNPSFVVNSLNIHRLLITSVMLGAKFFDDQYFNNSYYAKVGGVPPQEMNSLEVEFLFMTNFSLFVTTETYRQYYTELCNHAVNSACGCATMPIPQLIIPASFTQNVTYRSDLKDDAGLPATGYPPVVEEQGFAPQMERDVYMPLNTYGNRRPVATLPAGDSLAAPMATDSPSVAPMAASPQPS